MTGQSEGRADDSQGRRIPELESEYCGLASRDKGVRPEPLSSAYLSICGISSVSRSISSRVSASRSARGTGPGGQRQGQSGGGKAWCAPRPWTAAAASASQRRKTSLPDGRVGSRAAQRAQSGAPQTNGESAEEDAEGAEGRCSRQAAGVRGAPGARARLGPGGRNVAGGRVDREGPGESRGAKRADGEGPADSRGEGVSTGASAASPAVRSGTAAARADVLGR